MAKQEPEQYRIGKPQMFRSKAIPPPPGRKYRIKGRYLHPDDVAIAVARRWRRITLAVALAALAVGLLAGRFLLP
jgi:hypothetical protein